MISSDKGKITIDGNLIELFADLSTLVCGLKSLLKKEITNELACALIKNAVCEGLEEFSKEENDENFERNTKEFFKALDGIGE